VNRYFGSGFTNCGVWSSVQLLAGGFLERLRRCIVAQPA